jgi:hypothetical protein
MSDSNGGIRLGVRRRTESTSSSLYKSALHKTWPARRLSGEEPDAQAGRDFCCIASRTIRISPLISRQGLGTSLQTTYRCFVTIDVLYRDMGRCSGQYGRANSLSISMLHIWDQSIPFDPDQENLLLSKLNLFNCHHARSLPPRHGCQCRNFPGSDRFA